MKEYIILDIETSGLKQNLNTILSIAIKKYGTKYTDEFLVKPEKGKQIDDYAMSVNNLDLEVCKKKGLKPNGVYSRIKNFIDRHYIEKPMVMGQNVGFDWGFIESYLSTYGYDIEKLFNYHKMDTGSNCLLMKELGLYPKDLSTSLTAQYKYYTGKDPENAHNALYDVEMTEIVYNNQKSKLESLLK